MNLRKADVIPMFSFLGHCVICFEARHPHQLSLSLRTRPGSTAGTLDVIFSAPRQGKILQLDVSENAYMTC